MRIAIVPARGGSTRIPDKNIVDFFGRPLMARVMEAAEKSGLFDVIHVSTDSPRIAEVAKSLGHAVEFMRDPALADGHTPLMPVLQWVLAQYAEMGKRFEEICLLMPTAPLIEAGDLRRAHALFAERGGTKPVMAVARLPVPAEWAFHLSKDGVLQPCQPGMANVRSQDLEPAYYDSGTFIFFPEAAIGAESPEYLGYVLPRHKAVDIDEPEDLELARIIYRGLEADMTGGSR